MLLWTCNALFIVAHIQCDVQSYTVWHSYLENLHQYADLGKLLLEVEDASVRSKMCAYQGSEVRADPSCGQPRYVQIFGRPLCPKLLRFSAMQSIVTVLNSCAFRCRKPKTLQIHTDLNMLTQSGASTEEALCSCVFACATESSRCVLLFSWFLCFMDVGRSITSVKHSSFLRKMFLTAG